MTALGSWRGERCRVSAQPPSSAVCHRGGAADSAGGAGRASPPPSPACGEGRGRAPGWNSASRGEGCGGRGRRRRAGVGRGAAEGVRAAAGAFSAALPGWGELGAQRGEGLGGESSHPECPAPLCVRAAAWIGLFAVPVTWRCSLFVVFFPSAFWRNAKKCGVSWVSQSRVCVNLVVAAWKREKSWKIKSVCGPRQNSSLSKGPECKDWFPWKSWAAGLYREDARFVLWHTLELKPQPTEPLSEHGIIPHIGRPCEATPSPLQGKSNSSAFLNTSLNAIPKCCLRVAKGGLWSGFPWAASGVACALHPLLSACSKWLLPRCCWANTCLQRQPSARLWLTKTT